MIRLVRVVGLSAWQDDRLEDKGRRVGSPAGVQRCGGCATARVGALMSRLASSEVGVDGRFTRVIAASAE